MSTKPTPKPAVPANRDRTFLLGFLVQRRGNDGRMQIRVRWGRLFFAGVALFVASWVSVAVLLFFYFKHKHDFADVTLSGMMTLPFRLDEHRVEMGTFHIEQGLEALQQGDGRTAFSKLRVGILRAPDHLVGRTTLAELFEFGWRRPDFAADAMVGGLRHGGVDDVDFVRRTLAVLLRHQKDEIVQEIAVQHIREDPQTDDERLINQLFAFGAARANHYRGNYDRAEEYLREFELLNSVEGVLLSAQITWERGQRDAAVATLEEALRSFGNSEAVFLQLSRFFREKGEIDRARRYAVLRNTSNPLAVAPRIELLYIYDASGDTARAESEAQQILRQFRDDERAITSLANYAADTGKVRLARRTYQLALESEFNVSSFALLLIEAHLVAQDYRGAVDFTEELVRENPDWLQTRDSVFNSLRAVSNFAIGREDLATIYLQRFIQAADTRVETFLAVSRRLEEVGHVRQSQMVLMEAYRRNPGNQSAITELIRVELALGNSSELPGLLRRLLAMRRPSTDVIASAYSTLGSDRFIFAQDREVLLRELATALREANVPVPSV